MTPEEFKNIQKDLPNQPGIYKYYDERGKMLYVGKAKNIRKRVSSYFVQNRLDSARLKLLVKKIAKVDFTIVSSEQDALLLENNLIKSHQPKYNIQLKDDKSYPFIVIKKERFPRVFLTRQMVNDGSEYFGPYTSVKIVRSILQMIRSLFQLRTCNLNLSEKNIAQGKYKVCLEYHIGNCRGPCEALQQEEEYNKAIQQIRHILKGNVGMVIQLLKKDMQEFAESYDFERANELKKKIGRLQSYQGKSTVVNPKISDVDVFGLVQDGQTAFVNYLKVNNGTVTQTKTVELKNKLDEPKEVILSFAIIELRHQFTSHSKELIVPFEIDYPDDELTVTVPKIGDKKHLLALAQKNAFYYQQQRMTRLDKHKKKQNNPVLEKLQEDLNLEELPVHIECFDNSNIQGSNPVASVVVFKNGKPSHKDYRHFNIRTVEGPNDFASMEEIVLRRYKRLLDEKQPLPQLVVIDGGKGQLNAAVSSLEKLGLEDKLAVISIAKRLEEIYFPGDPLPLHLDKRSFSLKLIQHLRNEAHRFAINFHRLKRQKNSVSTELTDIEGIGEGTANKLLRHYKSIKKLRQASLQELASVIGISKAKLVSSHFAQEVTDQ